MAKIYLASSWRNKLQQQIVSIIRENGHQVYDFKHPKDGIMGFSWAEIDPNWEKWNIEEYKKALFNPCAERGFKRDFNAMKDADVCVLLLPCGKSAHTEAGWMKGHGKKVVVLMTQPQEAELMYKLFDKVFSNTSELVRYLNDLEGKYTDEFFALNLIVHGDYYDMIQDGVKKEEYRELKPYWLKRLFELNLEHLTNKNAITKKITDKWLTGMINQKYDLALLVKEKIVLPKKYSHVCFRRGYTNTPLFTKFIDTTTGLGNPDWGAPKKPVFIIKLGKIEDIKML